MAEQTSLGTSKNNKRSRFSLKRQPKNRGLYPSIPKAVCISALIKNHI
jgi:hypothetical protein